MLFVHDVYAVIGEREFDFEDEVRDGYAATVADDDTRLLWYLFSTHGSSDSYQVEMFTAVRDGAAFERLAERLRYGDLSEWSMRVSALRYGAHSTLLVAPDWSPLAGLDLETVPVDGVDHPGAIFREDALEGAGVHAAVAASASARSDGADGDVLTFAAAFRPALDSDHALRLLYEVAEPEQWTPVFGADSGWSDWPGSLTPTLPDGVTGSGRYLRTSSWSPMG